MSLGLLVPSAYATQITSTTYSRSDKNNSKNRRNTSNNISNTSNYASNPVSNHHTFDRGEERTLDRAGRVEERRAGQGEERTLDRMDEREEK